MGKIKRTDRWLGYAVTHGWVWLARLALALGADVEGRSMYVLCIGGPLRTAVQEGHLGMVKYLRRKGACIEDDMVGAAAISGNLRLVQYLHRAGLPLDPPAGTDPSALIHAADCGHMSIVRYLCENGADVDYRNEYGTTALMVAAYKGRYHAAAVDCLCTFGADPNLQDRNGRTALMYAVNQGVLPVVKYLCERGADANIQDADGETALMYAARTERDDVVKCLLDTGGVDVNRENKEGKTALHLLADPRRIYASPRV